MSTSTSASTPYSTPVNTPLSPHPFSPPTPHTPYTPLTEGEGGENERQRREKARTHKAQILQLMKVWRAVASHRFAGIFKHPVGAEEAPDYDNIIRRRMDLSTIRKRLEDGTTKTSTEFWRDILLMFQNAMIYNSKESEVYTMAVTLRKFAMKEMESVFATEELLKSPHPTTRSARGPPSGEKDKKGTRGFRLDESADSVKIKDENTSNNFSETSSLASSTASFEAEKEEKEQEQEKENENEKEKEKEKEKDNGKEKKVYRTRKVKEQEEKEKEAQQQSGVTRRWKRQRRPDETKSDRSADEDVDIMED
jgi:hypothetical protein